MFEVILFFLGAVVGSFLNVVILRGIKEQPATGRSACPHCGQMLRWWELVPVLSFTFLGGACRRCQRPISVQYPVVELCIGIVALILGSRVITMPTELIPQLLLGIIIAWLVVLFVIDLSTFLLPDKFIIGLSVSVALYLLVSQRLFIVPLSIIGGAVVGSGFLTLLWLITKRQGIGVGDIKLLVPLGALFGFGDTLVLLWMAFMTGGTLGLWLLMRRRATLKTAVPFGPFLAGTAIVFLLAPALIDYLWSWWAV